MDLQTIIENLRSSFQSIETKKKVVSTDWFEKNIDSNIDSTGFCFAASEVIYRLTGGKKVWFIKCINKKDWEYGPHYFLEKKENNQLLDITANQYLEKGISIPYELGKAKGLRCISKKAQILASSCGLKLIRQYK